MTGAKQRRKGKGRVKELSQQVKIFEQLLRNGGHIPALGFSLLTCTRRLPEWSSSRLLTIRKEMLGAAAKQRGFPP